MSKSALLATLLVLGATSPRAQTNYPIPSSANPGFIDYGQKYCNLTLPAVAETIDGVSHEVDATIHFTPGNSAATYGTITFAPNGAWTKAFSETLTSITGTLGPWNGNSSFAANFSGQLNGSLVFNVDFSHMTSGRFPQPVHDMPNSYFTID